MSKVQRLRKITTAEAAAIMGKDQLFVREAMKQGLLNIGVAMLMPGSKVRWSYFISAQLLADYLGITVDQLWEMLPEEESEE